MFSDLPKTVQVFMDWPWTQIEPYYLALIERPIDATNVDAWLADWSRLTDLIQETFTRLQIATAVDTTDQDAQSRYQEFLDQIFPSFASDGAEIKGKIAVQWIRTGRV